MLTRSRRILRSIVGVSVLHGGVCVSDIISVVWRRSWRRRHRDRFRMGSHRGSFRGRCRRLVAFVCVSQRRLGLLRLSSVFGSQLWGMRAQPIVVLRRTPSGGVLICLPLRLHVDQPQPSFIRIQINRLSKSRDDSCRRSRQHTCTVPVDDSGPETTAARRLDSRWGELGERWRCLTQAV